MKKFIFVFFSITTMISVSQAQTLDVQYLNPKFTTNTDYKFLRFGTSTEHYAGFLWNNSSANFGNGNDFSIFTYENRDMTIRTGSGNFIVFPSDGGKMGIGTTAPDAKLTVKGNIHAREVKVDLAGAIAPDYVFEEDYPLRSLEEVQVHIEEKGHLPGIPSAKEMEEEGIKLKEMNLKLLEKVEELTLYAIQQKEENQSLKVRVKHLEAIVKDLRSKKQ